MRHSLHVTVHSAQLELRACAGSLVCCAQVASADAVSLRAVTDEATVAHCSGSDSACVSWEEEVAFFVGSCERPQHLKLVLYAPAGSGEPVSGGGDGGSEGREYVAAGSLGLDALLEAHGGSCSSGRRQHVSVPVVDEVGKHAGEVHCTLLVTAPPPTPTEQHATRDS